MDEILQYEADHDDGNTARVRSEVVETILYQRALRAAQNAMEKELPYILLSH